MTRARRKLALKRGGGLERAELELDGLQAEVPDDKLIALDAALDRLAAEHPEKAEVVKLRYFVRMTTSQAAQSLGISTATADRYWAYARAWLHQRLAEDE